MKFSSKKLGKNFKMINIIIDGKNLQMEEGKTILEAAREASIRIPTLCYHKMLTPYGSCRLCLVEVIRGGRTAIHSSCLYKVTEGLEVKTNTERLRKIRKIILELLLARCPDAEAVKALAEEYGITQVRISRKNKEDCILCGLCVRVCKEITGMNAINFTGRGSRKKVQTPFNKISETCIGCGACAYICPIKAIKIEEKVEI
ncbi:MAG: 2Fe-2S iron-sulfur cluster-binding protein [bacterium]